MADGIAPVAGMPLTATAGVPLTNVIVATFTVTDPTATPATGWRAFVQWGDGQADKQVVPTAEANGTFAFLDTHTYAASGTFTITVQIAVPGTHKPNDNTITVLVTVNAPLPPPSPLTATALNVHATAGRSFRGTVGTFAEANTKTKNFHVTINWGDQSAPSSGRIKSLGGGQFAVTGAHRFGQPGTFSLQVVVSDFAGHQASADAIASVQPGGKRHR
jgi:hypothetical protein